jgi:2-polyprenyl-3-methyl-5-hydroxy-6-metoxy-1,4-benzoquinol methylase
MSVQEQAPQQAIDEGKVEAFMGKVLGDFSATMTVTLCVIGDRLGLFRDLAQAGPATAGELAARTGIDERYALEWMRGLTSAGYLEHDRSSDCFSLPPEHAPALAEEGGPMFVGGAHQMIPGAMGVLDELTERFRSGGGVTQDAYSPEFWAGMERFSAGWLDNMLMQQLMPQMPDLDAKLKAGARCADIGCGSGKASIKLATEYPDTTHVGYDVSDAQLERAQRNAKEAGLGDRVRFEKLDAASGLPEKYDVITTFDVIHDAVDPLGLLKSIRAGLEDDGIYVCMDINCADDPADNEGPLAAMFYGFSVLYCMTTSLAHGGAGLGTCGLPESKLRELAEQAGFSEVRRVPVEDPFNITYEIRA